MTDWKIENSIDDYLEYQLKKKYRKFSIINIEQCLTTPKDV